MTERNIDDVSIDELREAVEHMHGAKATYVETVDVDERFKRAVVWQGAVKVFRLAQHPSGATKVYAWSHLGRAAPSACCPIPRYLPSQLVARRRARVRETG